MECGDKGIIFSEIYCEAAAERMHPTRDGAATKRQTKADVTFADHILTVLPHTFGEEWWKTEVVKPADQRHTAFQWRATTVTYQEKQRQNPDDSSSAQMTGSMLACYAFAYDPFTGTMLCLLGSGNTTATPAGKLFRRHRKAQ
jgi:hypothetical protein